MNSRNNLHAVNSGEPSRASGGNNRNHCREGFLQHLKSGLSDMSTPTTQIPIEFKGQSYSGVYSVSGSLLIARVPGVGSRSAEPTGDEKETAHSLCNAILEEADSVGLL